jgi:3-oxoadipate enol-lactonase
MVNPYFSMLREQREYEGVSYGAVGPAGAPVLVLANSLGTNRRLWSEQVGDWARDHRIVCFDYPGHGSPAWGEAPSIGAVAARVARLLDHLGVERYAFCGVSMGGAVGMALAALHGARLQRLVLSNTAASFGDPAFWTARGATALASGVAALADATLARWFTPAFADAHPSIVAFYRAMLCATEPAGYQWCCDAIRDFDFRERLAAIRQPTLVLAGAHDAATPPARGREIAAAIDGAAYIELDAAHLGNAGAAPAFTAAVRDFLAGAAQPSNVPGSSELEPQ